MNISIQAWAKSPEGIELIEQQRPFVLGGEIWQGYEMQMFRVEEMELTDSELEDAVDVDGSKEAIFGTRQRRLAGRANRKADEYMQRRGKLRERRNSILESIERMKKLGVEPGPDELAEIKDIDARMAQLVVGQQELKQQAKPEPQIVTPDQATLQQVTCQGCGKISPQGHGSPEKWLHGHKLHCKGG